MSVLFPLVFFPRHLLQREPRKSSVYYALLRAEFQFLPARLPAHKYIKQEHIPTPREPDKECKIFRKYFLPGDSRVSQLRVACRIFLLLKLRDSVLWIIHRFRVSPNSSDPQTRLTNVNTGHTCVSSHRISLLCKFLAKRYTCGVHRLCLQAEKR